MEPVRSVVEMMDLAIELERRACDLYQELAEKTSNGAARDVFMGLAADEAGHRRKLEGIKTKGHLAGVTRKEPNWEVIDHFTEIQPAENMTLLEALAFAIQCEKNSIYFYSEMAESPENDDFKVLLNALAAEEEKHKNRLEAVYEETLQCGGDLIR